MRGYCGWLKVSDLEKRAGFEVSCERVAVRELSEGTYGVEGCGNRATYLYVHKGWGNYEGRLASARKTRDEGRVARGQRTVRIGV